METMRNIDKILFDKKPHKIKKEVVIKPKAEGRLAMVDINKKNVALKLTWIKRIIEGKENKNFSILEIYLKYYIKPKIKGQHLSSRLRSVLERQCPSVLDENTQTLVQL